jgi:hypothetical protein
MGELFMSNASSNASDFYKTVAENKMIYTLLSDGCYLVFPINGIETVPFWSSKSRMEKIQKLHSQYQEYDVDETDLESFMNKSLPDLQDEKIHFGINWSGKKLSGYNLTADELRANLEYWLSKS